MRAREDTDFCLAANAAAGCIADGLDQSKSRRPDRPPAYPPKPAICLARRINSTARIVKEPEFLNLELNDKDVARLQYRPRKCRRADHVVALRKNISRFRV